jgi:hypothetical protein
MYEIKRFVIIKFIVIDVVTKQQKLMGVKEEVPLIL